MKRGWEPFPPPPPTHTGCLPVSIPNNCVASSGGQDDLRASPDTLQPRGLCGLVPPSGLSNPQIPDAQEAEAPFPQGQEAGVLPVSLLGGSPGAWIGAYAIEQGEELLETMGEVTKGDQLKRYETM